MTMRRLGAAASRVSTLAASRCGQARRARAAAAVCSVVLLAGCAAGPRGPSIASPTPTLRTSVVHGTGVAKPFDAAELRDLATYAKSSGRPVEEVLAGQRGARELRELAAALEADPASGSVMTGHDPDRPGTAYMSFTHEPSAAVLARVEALPLDTTVTSGLPLPHDELVRYSESLAGSLRGIDGVRFLSCGPTALGDAVEVRYAVTGTAPSAETLEAAALRATRRWSTGGRLAVPVRFIVGSAGERISNLVPPDVQGH